MHEAARAALVEFGGLSFGNVEPGVDFSASDIDFDPRVAVGEEDRLLEYFDELRGRHAYPLGQCHRGHAWLVVDEQGRGYQLGDRVHLVAESVDALLEAVLLGQQPRGASPDGGQRGDV
jgi:SUKH-3 immunity protein